MKWKAEYSIGIAAIDRQHHKIFELLLAVENAMVKRDPWHILQYHLAQLREYIAFHFAVEESLLEILGYGEIGPHREAHGRLENTLRELERQLKERPSPEVLVEFFQRWFVSHVLHEDVRYVELLKDKLSRP